MGVEEKKIAQSIIEAVSALPEEKREYILGYAEGVIAMAERWANMTNHQLVEQNSS